MQPRAVPADAPWRRSAGRRSCRLLAGCALATPLLRFGAAAPSPTPPAPSRWPSRPSACSSRRRPCSWSLVVATSGCDAPARWFGVATAVGSVVVAGTWSRDHDGTDAVCVDIPVPLKIREADFADPTLTRAGEGWSFNSRSAWRITAGGVLVFGWSGVAAADLVRDPCGQSIVSVTPQSPGMADDPAFGVSSGQWLKVFSDWPSVAEPAAPGATTRHPGSFAYVHRLPHTAADLRPDARQRMAERGRLFIAGFLVQEAREHTGAVPARHRPSHPNPSPSRSSR